MKSILQNAVEYGMQRRFSYFGNPGAKNNLGNATTENRILDQITAIHLMRRKMKAGFEVSLNQAISRSNELCTIAESPDADLIKTWLNIDGLQIRAVFCNYAISPALLAFIKHAENVRQIYGFSDIEAVTDGRLPGIIQAINQTLKEIRFSLEHGEVGLADRNFTHSSNKNRRSLRDYFSGLLQKYKVLPAVRIDLGYTNGAGPLMQWPGVSLEELKRHRNALIRHLAFDFSADLIGYAIKLEHSAGTGCRYHCLFFLAIDNETDLEAAGEDIGSYWNEYVTMGAGVYFHWNRSMKGYSAPGVGNIRQMSEFNSVIRYYTGLDRYLKLSVERSRSLFRGQVR
jgi:hypothetical protein